MSSNCNISKHSNFGWSIDMNNFGSGILIGAHKSNLDATSQQKKNVGKTWYYTKYKDIWRKIPYVSPNSTKNGEFGISVSVDNENTIAIGERFYSNINFESTPFDYGFGAVHLYKYQHSNFPDSYYSGLFTGNGSKFSQFGYSIDLNNNGDILVVGAPTDINTINNITGGKVYLYKNINNNWQLQHILTGTGNFEYFGKCVKINSGNLIVIAENKFFHIYNYDGNIINKTNSFNLENNYVQTSYNHNFNKFIDISNDSNTILIGNYAGNKLNGSASLYNKVGNNWQLSNIFSGNKNSGFFGASVSIGLDNFYIGSPKENAVYVYNLINKQLINKIKNDCFEGLGNSIASDKNSNFLAIGSYLTTINDIVSGDGAVFLQNEKQTCISSSKCEIVNKNTLSSLDYGATNIWVEKINGIAYKKGEAFVLDPYFNTPFIGKLLENLNPYCDMVIWGGNQEGTIFQNNDIVKFNQNLSGRLNTNYGYRIEIINDFELNNYNSQVLIIRDCIIL